MKIFGDGRIGLVGDASTAQLLGWRARRRSRPDPELLLRPRAGDPCREPWIAPPSWCAAPGAEPLWRGRSGRGPWTYLPGAPGVARYLDAMAKPVRRGGLRVGLAGLGRVGGVAATLLAALPTRVTGIRELLIYDADASNQERWLLELGSIAAWRAPGVRPCVRSAPPTELFAACDLFLFAATTGVPPIGAAGDVRMAQFGPNRALLQAFLAAARAAVYTGLFLVVSDPVECLAQAAFCDSNRDGSGAFTGDGLAPERIGGLGLGVMWGRALACARQEGWERSLARRGAAYGPHGPDVVVFDDVRRPNRARSERLSQAARTGNLKVRELGHLPYVGPGTSSVGLMLPPLLTGNEALASVFLDGIYFGAPARLSWGLYPQPRPLAAEVKAALTALHGRLAAQADALDVRFGAAAGARAR